MIVKKLLFITAYFLLPVILIAAIFSSSPGYYGTSGFIPMVLGSTAYTFLLMQLVLSARPKWIERYFGLDHFYRFHGIIALIAILIAFIHKLIKGRVFPDSFQTKLGDIAVYTFIVAAVLSLVLMTDTLSRLFKPISVIRRHLLKWQLFRYHVQLILHNINVAAVLLIFIHVMLSFSAQNILVKLLYILYFAMAIGFYLYHKFLRRYFLSKRFIVEDIIHEAGSMTTLVLRPESGRMFHYLPGQLGFFRIKDRAVSQEEHPFSISSQPRNEKHLNVTIKNLGDWTAGVQYIKKGSKVLLDAPYGRFSPVLYHCNDGIALIAGGVGITPMLSILRYYFDTDRNQKLLLLWGVNQGNELICMDEFSAFQKEMRNFTFIPVAANDPNFSGEKGYVTKDLIQRALTKGGLESSKVQYFFCGPAPMWNAVRKSLNAMHINGHNIHHENFSL